MTKYTIPDMSCGHCKATVEKTVRALDATAEIDIDLTARTATITDTAEPAAIAAALAAAGYPTETQ